MPNGDSRKQVIDVPSVLTNPGPPPDEVLKGGVASTAFVAATQGMELGHLALPSLRLKVPEEYEPAPDLVLWNWASSAQNAVGPVVDFRDQVRLYQRVLANAKRHAAESVADALEDRHAHRSAMRAVARDPVFAQFTHLGSAATSVALRRLTDESHRPLWLYVLQSMSEARPAHGADGLDAATRAWRDWGRQHGLIP